MFIARELIRECHAWAVIIHAHVRERKKERIEQNWTEDGKERLKREAEKLKEKA